MKITDIFARNGLVIQQETYTCGPCTILNVLRLKGDAAHTEAELAKLSNAKPGVGVPNQDMVALANATGLQVAEEKANASLADIERHLDNGAYVVINFIDQYSGNGHYAVIAEHDHRAFYLCDCTSGFFRFEKQFFVKFWRGSSGTKQWFMAVS